MRILHFSKMAAPIIVSLGALALTGLVSWAANLAAIRFALPRAALLIAAGFLLGPGFSGLVDPARESLPFSVIAHVLVFIAGTRASGPRGLPSAIAATGTLAASLVAGLAAVLWFPGADARAALTAGMLFLAAALPQYGIMPAAALFAMILASGRDSPLFGFMAAAGLQRGAQPFAGVIAALAIAAALLVLVSPFIRGFRRISGGNALAEYAVLVGSAALIVWISWFTGMGTAAGAFLAGMALRATLAANTGTLSGSRIGDIERTLLTPFLFCQAGLLLGFVTGMQPFTAILTTGYMAVLALLVRAAGTLLRARGLPAARNPGVTDTDAAGLAFAIAAGSAGVAPQGLLQGLVVAAALGGFFDRILPDLSAKPAIGSERGHRESGDLPPPEASRILVALSKPSTALELLELAFSLRAAGSVEPVFPLAVVTENRESESGFSRAEDMLAEAMLKGHSSPVPLVPVTQVAANVSTGILQAAIEQRADTIVIGWHQPPRLEHAFFGSVIERVVAGGSAFTVVARLPDSGKRAKPADTKRLLRKARHLCVIAPPMSDTHPGFGCAVRSLAALAANLQMRVTIATLSPHGGRISAAMETSGPFRGMRAVEAPDWRSLADTLDHIGSRNARVIAIISARLGQTSWHPAMERLLHLLGQRFSRDALLMAYLPSPDSGGRSAAASMDDPAGASVGAAGASPATPDAAHTGLTAGPDRAAALLADAVVAGRVCLRMRDRAIADGIRQMLSAAFPSDRRAVAALGSVFTGIAQRSPIELAPGVVLLHARTPLVSREIVCFGSGTEGYRLSALDVPARVLVLICVPEQAAPEEHLATLGDIARLMAGRRLAHRLLEVGDAAELLGDAPSSTTGS